MPTKKKVAKSPMSRVVEASPTTSNNQYSFQSFINFINNNFSLIFLFLVMFIAGFVIGSLWTEKQMLKTGTSKQALVQDAVQPDAGMPEGPDEATLKKVPAVSKDDHIRGKMNAQVTLIEYSDYECPFCNRFHPTMKQVMSEFGDKVAWVYRHFPLGFHANAQKLSEMSECVAKLGGSEKFWQFSDMLYEKIATDTSIAQLDNALGIVSQIGLNQIAVKSCVDNGEMAQKVTDQMNAGSNAGISGTPGTIVISKDGKYELIPGALPFEQVKAIIEKYL